MLNHKHLLTVKLKRFTCFLKENFQLSMFLCSYKPLNYFCIFQAVFFNTSVFGTFFPHNASAISQTSAVKHQKIKKMWL